MIFRKPKPPLMVVVPASYPPEVVERINDQLADVRDGEDIVIHGWNPGITILQCVNGEWIPLPIPEPEADEPPPSRRTLA